MNEGARGAIGSASNEGARGAIGSASNEGARGAIGSANNLPRRTTVDWVNSRFKTINDLDGTHYSSWTIYIIPFPWPSRIRFTLRSRRVTHVRYKREARDMWFAHARKKHGNRMRAAEVATKAWCNVTVLRWKYFFSVYLNIFLVNLAKICGSHASCMWKYSNFKCNVFCVRKWYLFVCLFQIVCWFMYNTSRFCRLQRLIQTFITWRRSLHTLRSEVCCSKRLPLCKLWIDFSLVYHGI